MPRPPYKELGHVGDAMAKRVYGILERSVTERRCGVPCRAGRG